MQAIKYILDLRLGEGEIDDIDHLGNRRVRTIQELAGDEFRKGFLKLRRTAQERMNLENVDTVTPRNLINSKTFSRRSSTSSRAASSARSSTRPTRCRS